MSTVTLTVANSNWPQKRADFKTRFDNLSAQGDRASVTDLEKLYSDIKSFLQSVSSESSLTALLEETGTLQEENKDLHKKLNKKNIDADSAVTRNELLRSRETNLTAHKLFLLNRPVRRNRLPYLWIIGVLFIGIALCIFNVISPPLPFTFQAKDGVIPTITGILTGLYQSFIELIFNPYLITSLVTAIMCVIIGIILKNQGKI
jgi:hypothetical protein